MKKKIVFIIFAIIGICLPFSVSAENADNILAKASSKAENAKGITAIFSASGPGKSMSGELKASGRKFYVKTGGMQAWYNGKLLYSYNPSTRETTVVEPTSSELSEINPLMYLKSYSSYFTSSFSKNKQSGKYIIDLKAKSRKSPAKKITVTLNASTLHPEKFEITSADGNVVSLTIKSLSYNAPHNPSAFEYPKKTLSDVKVIDLR